MSQVMPNIINDPELILDSPECSEEEDEVEEIVVEVARGHIDTDDIFEKQKKTKDLVVAPVKKEKKARKPMTEEHKAKLKLAREKAVIARKAKAVERKEFKDLESKAEVKKKSNKKKELEDLVNDVPAPRPTAEIDPNIIQKAIDEALTKSEMMRQQRKAEKKKNQNEAIERAKAEELIRKAVYPAASYYGDAGFFSKNVYGFQ
tara:strand:+ start:195 stop:806 length:612 start_codon:yes stop_codon:yes gene_type:complete